MRQAGKPSVGQRMGCYLAALLLGVTIGSVASNAPAYAANVLENTTESLSIEVNRGTLIRLDRPASDIFVANSNIADVQVKSPQLVYVFGKAEGETTLYALDSDESMIYSSNIQVTQNVEQVRRTIKSMLPTASIDVTAASGMIFLTGYVSSPEEADVAQRLASALVSGNAERIVNRLEISTPTQINLQVKIAEIGRGTLKQLGFNWESAIAPGGGTFFGFSQGADVTDDILLDLFDPTREFATGNNGTNSLIGSITGDHFDLNTVIDALDNEGYLSVLAEPNLTALSGETATFLAGGEFPVPVPTGSAGGAGGQFTVEFKQFGVGLAFTPTVLSENKINLQVSPEVSQLSNAGAVTVNGISIPALSTRRVSTTVELASGQSFAIAGLLSDTVTKDNSKFPGLGDIPILGALFQSDRFQRQETELVVIVTPYIVRPFSANRVVLPTDAMREPSDMDRYLKGDTFKKTAQPADLPAESGQGVTLAGSAGFRLKK